MSTDTHALIRRHAAHLDDRMDADEVPAGWRALVGELFHDMAELLADHPGVRLQVHRVREKRGCLRVDLYGGSGTGDADALVAVQPLIAAAEARSVATCQVCGKPGRPRRADSGVAALCDAHAPQPAPSPSSEEDGGDGWESTWLPAVDDSNARGTGEPVQPAATRGRAAALVGAVPHGPHRLYALRAVAAAVGWSADGADADGFVPDRTETEYEARIAAILRQGEAGTWRDLAHPSQACLDALDRLDAAAPHMGEVTALVRRHVRAALSIGLHLQLPPVMLLGEPGLGKSWYLTRLGAALGVPVRTYPMNASSLSEGLQGSNPTWRNAAPGLVAKTLLLERVANPVILVDEVDKPGAGHWNQDPYRPFYSLLEPSGAQCFRDEYLGFELDASAVSWVLAGNDLSPLPLPILDRLTVIEIPPLSRHHLAAVVASVYAEANAGMRAYFEPDLAPDVLDPLLRLTPRAIRLTLQDAMVQAAAAGRRRLVPADLDLRRRDPPSRFGFRAGQE